MVIVYHSVINYELTSDHYDRYFCDLPEYYQRKLMRFRRREDRQASLIGKALLAKGLNRLGLDESYLQKLTSDRYDRPGIIGSIDFNISHSDNHVVCALTDSGRIGIDIEMIRPIELSYYVDHFKQDLKDSLLRSENRLLAFFRYWTMIESAMKADGRGMNIPVSDVEVKKDMAFIDNKKWYLHEIQTGKATVCYCASENSLEHIKVEKKYFS